MPEAPRQLAFRDRFVWELEQTLAARFADCDGFVDRYIFPDLTTLVPFVLYLSQEEFTRLYSAVLTGADLTYPNQSHDIEYLLLQMVICPMNSLCQAIADCIENSEATQAALRAFLAGEGMTGGVGDPEAPVSDGSLSENLLPDGYSCTDDLAFGMALAIVEAIHSATTEVLQAIEILTNSLELANELADNVPGIGLLAMATDTIAWIQDTAEEEYDAAWSDVVRDELACRLWCLFKDDCYLSFDTIWEVYLEASGAVLPTGDTLEEWLDWLFGLPLVVPLATVASVSLLGLLAMRYGGRFGAFYLGVRSLKTVIALSAGETSSAWSIVCDTCADGWAYEIDLTVGLGEFTVIHGTWTDGVGVVSEVINGRASAAVLLEVDAATYLWRRVRVEYLRTSGGSYLDDIRVILWTDFDLETGRYNWLERNDEDSGTKVYCPDPAPPAGPARKQISFFVRDNVSTDTITLKKVKVYHTNEASPPAPLTDNSTPDCT